MSFVALGPLVYELAGWAPPLLDPFRTAPAPGARRVEVVVGEAFPPDATPVHGAAVRALEDGDTVYLPGDRDPARMVHGPIAQLVARDLSALGALLLHASAVRVDGGVALLTGPPGVGKTTFARHDPARAFAGNAVCARRGDHGWVAAALPFASDPDPSLDAPGEAPVVAIAELAWAPSPSLEWLPGARATFIVARACVVPVLGAAPRATRAAAALDLAASVAIASLRAAGTRADLDLLDRSLHLRAHR